LLEEVFRREIRLTLEQFKHLYIFGTAGEGHAVDTRRFKQIVDVFYHETLDRYPEDAVYPMVGVIGLSTANVVERLDYAFGVGFRVFQISLPSWGVLNNRELLRFFEDVCGTFPEARFLHYNLPRAGRVLTGTDYARILELVPNLVATKNTGGGLAKATDLLTHAPELQHFLGEEGFGHGALIGECSLLSSMGPMTPHKAWELFRAGIERDVERIVTLQHGFHRLVTSVLGPLLVDRRIDGAYDKIIVRLGGLEEMPLRLLSPYQGFTEEEYRGCKERFHQSFPDWVASPPKERT
jgi:dihydrodipicolinate synthase/N-acetylneuraminate lyase